MTAATEKVLAEAEARARREAQRRGKASDPMAGLVRAIADAVGAEWPVSAEVEAGLRAQARALGVTEAGFERAWRRIVRSEERRRRLAEIGEARQAKMAARAAVPVMVAEPDLRGVARAKAEAALQPRPVPEAPKRRVPWSSPAQDPKRRVPGEDGGPQRKESGRGWRPWNPRERG